MANQIPFPTFENPGYTTDNWENSYFRFVINN